MRRILILGVLGAGVLLPAAAEASPPTTQHEICIVTRAADPQLIPGRSSGTDDEPRDICVTW